MESYMKPFIFTLALLSSATLLTTCDNIKKVLPQAENEKSQQSVKAEEKTIQNKPYLQGIETLVDNKVAESIKFLNEESRRSASDDDYFKYTLNSKNIINNLLFLKRIRVLIPRKWNKNLEKDKTRITFQDEV